MILSKEELGKLVKSARKMKSEKLGAKYTQVMLAKDINKSQGYIGDIESGRTYPTFKVLSKIAEACGVPFSFFGSDEDEYTDLVENNDTDLTAPVKHAHINDVKSAMELIMAQPGLMLNGEMLSDESKIALANAIQLGLQYAEQLQKKERSKE